MKTHITLLSALLSVFIFNNCSHLTKNDGTPGIPPKQPAIVATAKAPGTEPSTELPLADDEAIHAQTAHFEHASQPAASTPYLDRAQNAAIGSGELADAAIDNGDEGEKPTASDETTKEDQVILDDALDFCELSQSLWQKGELDNALEALDRAYALVLEVDTKQNAKLIQQKEDLRFLISKRILEIYASRNIVVNGNHGEIPMEMNRHIEKELKSFTLGHEKRYFIQAYQRSGRYRPYILQALKNAGLPEELSWLPLIESNFKVKALSRARALGLWQFIPSTGYKFGLKRTRYIDERIDFIKSTDAAIAYLKELHSIFGDWATVLAAYNCGEGRVLKVIRSQNVNYLDNFWDLYQRLPLETARYVPRFYATLHIVKHPEKYNLDQVEVDPPLTFETVEINRQAHLKDIAGAIGIDFADLQTLNPELRYSILPPETYSLRVPAEKTDTLLTRLDAVPASSLPQPAYTYHRVRHGETLGTISRRYRTSVGKIMRANNLKSSHFIRAGKRLRIPLRGTTVARRTLKPPAADFSGVHSVVKGDSLWIIARRYGTTVQQIIGLNNLPSSSLHIGQKLRIPGYKPEPLPNADQLSTYMVKRGDSPFAIAQKHNMPLERFLRINRLTPRSKIYPGQKLFIE